MTVKVGRDAVTIQPGKTVPVVAAGDVLGRLEEIHGLKVSSAERDAPPAPTSKKGIALAAQTPRPTPAPTSVPPRTPSTPKPKATAKPEAPSVADKPAA